MKKLSKKEWIAVAVSIVFVAYTLFGGNIMAIFQGQSSDQNLLAGADLSSRGGVIVNDVLVGSRESVVPGQLLSLHYTLSLSDGTVVQSSRDLGIPIKFVLGDSDLLPSFESGLSGMKVGGIRTIIIPPQIGYGAVQNGPIPPNSTLIFTVEILSAENVPPQAI